MLQDLFPKFPGINSLNARRTSPPDRQYNCIGWAAEDTKDKWWWPLYNNYWPPHVRREESIQSFLDAFATLDYVKCDDGSLEIGFEKVCLYLDSVNIPTHMARQLSNGKWTSKMGPHIDIEHDFVECLNSDEYGTASIFMKRPKRNL